MELTTEQIERQDFIDNKIMSLLHDVNPTNQVLDWDIEIISTIRDCISEYLTKKTNCSSDDFYPTVK